MSRLRSTLCYVVDTSLFLIRLYVVWTSIFKNHFVVVRNLKVKTPIEVFPQIHQVASAVLQPLEQLVPSKNGK